MKFSKKNFLSKLFQSGIAALTMTGLMFFCLASSSVMLGMEEEEKKEEEIFEDINNLPKVDANFGGNDVSKLVLFGSAKKEGRGQLNLFLGNDPLQRREKTTEDKLKDAEDEVAVERKKNEAKRKTDIEESKKNLKHALKKADELRKDRNNVAIKIAKMRKEETEDGRVEAEMAEFLNAAKKKEIGKSSFLLTRENDSTQKERDEDIKSLMEQRKKTIFSLKEEHHREFNERKKKKEEKEKEEVEKDSGPFVEIDKNDREIKEEFKPDSFENDESVIKIDKQLAKLRLQNALREQQQLERLEKKLAYEKKMHEKNADLPYQIKLRKQQLRHKCKIEKKTKKPFITRFTNSVELGFDNAPQYFIVGGAQAAGSEVCKLAAQDLYMLFRNGVKLAADKLINDHSVEYYATALMFTGDMTIAKQTENDRLYKAAKNNLIKNIEKVNNIQAIKLVDKQFKESYYLLVKKAIGLKDQQGNTVGWFDENLAYWLDNAYVEIMEGKNVTPYKTWVLYKNNPEQQEQDEKMKKYVDIALGGLLVGTGVLGNLFLNML